MMEWWGVVSVFLVFEMVGGWVFCLVSYRFVVVWAVVVWVVVFLVVMDEWMDGKAARAWLLSVGLRLVLRRRPLLLRGGDVDRLYE